MNIQARSIRTVAAALAIGLAGCASQPPPRSRTYYAPPPAKPQPSGYVSVRYVQPTASPAAPAPTAAAQASADKQLPHWQRARAYLQAARAKLEAATTGKGGHRQAAISHTDEALAHVETGIARANSR